MIGLSYSEFIVLVEKMRTAQKDYFTLRTRTALERAKALERRVDALVLTMTVEQPVQHRLMEEVPQ